MKKTAKSMISAIALLAIVGTVTLGAASAWSRQPDPDGSERAVIGVNPEGSVRAVYQVTGDDWSDGVGKGLLRLKNGYEAYIEAGFSAEQLDIHAVFHGAAAAHLLTDVAWAEHKKVDESNPNTTLITELAELGVKVELCDSRRRKEGWAKSDIHPDVTLVANAFHRLTDLQLKGYAYIKF